MGFHPANLTFRFILEILGLVGLFRLGLGAVTGPWRWVLAVGLTAAGMILWATYRVPGDGSANGEAPMAVNGRVRLAIELVVLGLGSFGWFVAGQTWVAWAYLALLLAHHLLSLDRLGWLLRVDAHGHPAFSKPLGP